MTARDNMKVAITGATGLVGKNLSVYLNENGYHVVAVGRSIEKLEQLKDLGMEIKIANVEDKQSLLKAFDGVEVVVHAAGSVDPYGAKDAIFGTNYGGTVNALTAAAEKGITQFIHISSLSVITGQGDQYNVDETAPLQTCGENYADSKVKAETYVMDSDFDIEVTALRPGFIYGPGERAWLPKLINSIKNGKAMLIDGGHKETNVIYVGNLSKAIESAILNPASYKQVYNLTDGQKISKKQLFDAIADGMEIPRVKKQMPSAIAKFACQTISSIAPYLSENKQRSLSRFSKAAYRLAGVNQGFSIAKAERDLNYTKRTKFEDGMKVTLECFKQETSTRVSNGVISK